MGMTLRANTVIDHRDPVSIVLRLKEGARLTISVHLPCCFELLCAVNEVRVSSESPRCKGLELERVE
jgi:hypothetical protein